MAKFSIDKKDIPKRGKSLLLSDEATKTDATAASSIKGRSEVQAVNLPEGQTVNKKGPKYNNNPEYKKTTYYIRRSLEMNLQMLSLQQDRDLTELVNEAIRDLVDKYGK